MNDDAASKSTHRSPAYPSVNLETAITRIEAFWGYFTKATVPRHVALLKWGYHANTGPAARLIAAIKQFGLLAEDEDGISITDLGKDIVALPKQDKGYKDALKIALKSPRIYGELLEKYEGNVPDHDLLRSILIRQFEFNPKSVEGFIIDFYASVEYVAKAVLDANAAVQKQTEADVKKHLQDEGKIPKDDTGNADKPMPISSVTQLVNGKLSLVLEPDALLTPDDIESVEYYIDGFKMMVKAAGRKMAAQKQASEQPQS